MKFGLHVILAGLLLSLTSCSSISSLSFDTICPAEVTFPQGVRSIVVVNNAAEIPVDNNMIALLTVLPNRLHSGFRRPDILIR